MFESVKAHIDKDEHLKIRAGIDDLQKYSLISETLLLMQEMNCNSTEVWHLDDKYCTFVLLYKKEYGNFEKRFSELKMNEIKKK